MKCLPSALMDEDPDMLSTLLAVIDHRDAEAERLANTPRR
jgi:hypothetical protein